MLLGFHAKTSLQAAIRKTTDWYVAEGWLYSIDMDTVVVY